MEKTIIAKCQKFENKELQRATAVIIKTTESVGKGLLKIASVMAEIDTNRLYEDDFPTIYAYGEKVFGYKKSNVNNMVRVGRDYIDRETGKSILALEDGRDFTMHQLTALLPLKSTETAEEMVKDGEIEPEMTVAEIRNAVKSKIAETAEPEEGERTEVEKEEVESTEVEKEEVESTETVEPKENIVETAFNDAEIALTTICENIDDEKIAAKIRKMRDDLRKIMTSC